MMLMAAPFNATGTYGTATPAAPNLVLVAHSQTRDCGVAWIDSQVKRISKLKRNWDGYDAPAITLGQLNLLTSVLSSILPAGAPSGSIVPGADGSLQAEWHLRHASYGLVVEEGQPISVWYHPRGGAEIERTGIAAMSLLQYALLQTTV